jgi:hypothetical protein
MLSYVWKKLSEVRRIFQIYQQKFTNPRGYAKKVLFCYGLRELKRRLWTTGLRSTIIFSNSITNKFFYTFMSVLSELHLVNERPLLLHFCFTLKKIQGNKKQGNLCNFFTQGCFWSHFSKFGLFVCLRLIFQAECTRTHCQSHHKSGLRCKKVAIVVWVKFLLIYIRNIWARIFISNSYWKGYECRKFSNGYFRLNL